MDAKTGERRKKIAETNQRSFKHSFGFWKIFLFYNQ